MVLPPDRGPPARGEGGRRQWRRIWDPCQSFRVSPLNGLWRRNLLRFLGTRSLGLEDEVLEAPLICDRMGRRSPKSRIGKFMGPCLALPRVFLAWNPFFHRSILCSTCRSLNKSELIRVPFRGNCHVGNHPLTSMPLVVMEYTYTCRS